MSGQHGIYNFLKANAEVWFNTSDIARLMDMRLAQTSRHLNKMKRFPDLFEFLEEKEEIDHRHGKNFAVKYYRFCKGI